MTGARPSIGSLAIAGFIAVALGVAPVGLDDNYAPEIKSAFAKGKGSASGHSGSSSNRSSSSSSHGGGHANNGNGNGFGRDKANGNGHDTDYDVEAADNDYGKKASARGNLNAAHASPTALENAAPNSIVGLIADYAEGADAMTTAEAQAALGAISNKSSFDADLDADAVDAEVVAEVNALLGVENLPPVE